jgi:hypothetical protein
MYLYSYKYASVEKDAYKIWRFQRYFLVYEYFNKPIMPAPFEIFSFFLIGFRPLFRLICSPFIHDGPKSPNAFQRFLYDFTKPTKFGFSKHTFFVV